MVRENDPHWGYDGPPDRMITPGDREVPNTEPPVWALVIMVAVALAIITPFLIILWRWALI